MLLLLLLLGLLCSHLETDIAILTRVGSVTDTLGPRRCDAVGARAFVRRAFGFVVIHPPPSVTVCYLTSDQIFRRILDTARDADAPFIASCDKDATTHNV